MLVRTVHKRGCWWFQRILGLLAKQLFRRSKLVDTPYVSKEFTALFISEATPSQTGHSGSSRDLHRDHWVNANVRGLRHWNFHLNSFWLRGTIVALWRQLRKNEWEVLMITRQLLRNIRHTAMITPVSSLRTKLIHICPSYWTIYRSFEMNLEWDLSIRLEFKFNVL